MKTSSSLAVIASVGLLAACAGSTASTSTASRSDARHFTANPSQLVAAHNRLLAEIRTTDEPADIFKDYFVDNAPVLADRLVDVETMGLSRETMLTEFLKSDVRNVAISCDGRTGFSTGAIDTDEPYHSYDLIWKKNDKREWRVAFVHLDHEAEDGEAPDFIHSDVASCEDRPEPTGEKLSENGKRFADSSSDGSINWQAYAPPGGSPNFTLNLWNGKQWVGPWGEKWAGQD